MRHNIQIFYFYMLRKISPKHIHLIILVNVYFSISRYNLIINYFYLYLSCVL